jgi:hypothetical protein
VQILKNFPTLHGARRFITVFIRALHGPLSRVRSIQSTSLHPTSPRTFLILSTHLRLGLPSGLFPSGFPTVSYMNSSSPPIYVARSANLVLLGSIILIILGEEYKS